MAKKESFDEILKSGIDWSNRIIYWGTTDLDNGDDEDGSGFGWGNVERVIRALQIMEGIDPDKRIEIHMMSGGGEVCSMLRLIDEIESCEAPVHFVGGGVIASAASLVMAVCDFRSLHKNTIVMVHDGQTGIAGDWMDVKIQFDMNERLMESGWKLLADNSRMSEEFWKEVGQRDLYLTAEESVFLGIADAVLPGRDRSSVREDRNARLAIMPPKETLDAVDAAIKARIGLKASNRRS